MSDKSTVFALVTGCYSDYRVLATFATREDAQRAARRHKELDEWSDDARVETLDFYPEGVEPKRVVTHLFQCVLLDDGTIRDHHPNGDPHTASTSWDYDMLWAVGERPRLRYVRAPCYGNTGGRLEVTGLDERACAQAFSDRVRMFKVGAWDPRKHREINEEIGEVDR